MEKRIKDVRLLFTRSQTLTDPFVPAFLQAGGCLYALPTLEIIPTCPRPVLDKQLSQHSVKTVCVFVSRHAIHCVGPSLKRVPGWPNIRCVCLGPGSRLELMNQGIPDTAIISPLFPPYETESLLAHPFFSDPSVQGKHYWIFRGPPGRTLLRDALKASGAMVEEMTLYDRRLATLTPVLRNQWEKALANHNVTLISSAEGLQYLMNRIAQLADDSLRVRLLKQPLLLPSTRVSLLAKSFGFRYIIETGSLEKQSLLNALKTLFP